MRKVVIAFGTLSIILFSSILFAAWFLDMGNQDQLHFVEVWLRPVQSAEDSYHSAFGRYSESLEELGPRGAHLLEERFNHSEMRHQRLILTASATGYTIQVYPETWGPFGYGYTSLYTDETHGRVRRDWPWRASK